MNRRHSVGALLVAALAAAPFAALAQQPAKVWRIGMLETTSMAQNGANLNAFLKGMQDLGYAEGRNFVIDYRSGEGRSERYLDLASELIRAKVDVIVARGTPATLAARKATTTIPVVTTASAQPHLIVGSLARPGGNVTGLTSINSELYGKRIQLLKEIIPGLTRLATMQNLGNAAAVSGRRDLEAAAKALGMQLLMLDVRKPEDFAGAFELAAKQHVQAIVFGQDGLMQANGKRLVELVNKHRMPAMFQSRDYVFNGALMSYGVDYPDQYRRAAAYVDKIFKGAKAGDLPMEQPTNFDLVINLKAAKLLGISIPQPVLVRATELIR